jgi:DNA polymerase-3 subunit beta
MPGVILPRKAVGEVTKLLGEMEEPVTVSLSDQKIRFVFGGGALTLTSKLIDGTFPDYARVVPTVSPLKVVAEKDDLARAIDRVITVASERGRAVKFAVNGRSLTLSVTSSDTGGEAVEELEVDADTGTEITIGFNGRYMSDILGQIAGDTVSFGLTDAGSPALIQDVTPSGALFVLMPMRV